jgi:hypothetical protein
MGKKYIKELKGSTALKKEYLAYNKTAKQRGRKPIPYGKWVRNVKGVKGTEPRATKKGKSIFRTIAEKQKAKRRAVREATR